MCTIDLPCGGQMRLTILIDNRLVGYTKRTFQCMNGHTLDEFEQTAYKFTASDAGNMFIACRK